MYCALGLAEASLCPRVTTNPSSGARAADSQKRQHRCRRSQSLWLEVTERKLKHQIGPVVLTGTSSWKEIILTVTVHKNTMADKDKVVTARAVVQQCLYAKLQVKPSSEESPAEWVETRGSLEGRGTSDFHKLILSFSNDSHRGCPQRMKQNNICTVKFINDYKEVECQDGEKQCLQYSAAEAAYLYFYLFKGREYCVDGNGGRTGRFINDDHINPNAKIKLVTDKNGKLHLYCSWRQETTEIRQKVQHFESCPQQDSILHDDVEASMDEVEEIRIQNTKVKESSLPEDSGSEHSPLPEDCLGSSDAFTTDEEDLDSQRNGDLCLLFQRCTRRNNSKNGEHTAECETVRDR
ncbi:hypothetical protein NDU88_000540 [Pleurodeles waltl]|uniref:Uncharacterized protein n=1 Tax=Pleurodeles waltl TaxID=8319 RepID=A0AAV7ML53_PLEWA|nr:hypothetical protein NDU88_000540 [Pleurodeles waltl]